MSWVATVAAAASVLFLLVLGIFGYFSFVNKRPLIEIGLLAMPAVALALCFAARRIIRNSEGTRTDLLYGVNLVNTAWWLSLVLGLCYGAYLIAIDYAVHREAEGEMERWIKLVKSGGEEDIPRAFWLTIDPSKLAGTSRALTTWTKCGPILIYATGTSFFPTATSSASRSAIPTTSNSYRGP